MTSMKHKTENFVYYLHNITIAIILVVLITFANTVDSFAVKENQILKRIIRQDLGDPLLANCYKDKDEARKNHYFIKNALALEPKWSNENMYLPDLEMPEKYTWTYDAKREIIDPKTNQSTSSENFDIKKYKDTKSEAVKIPSFAGLPGLYTVNVKLALKSGQTGKSVSGFSCYFEIKVLEPLVVISGGFQRIVPNNKEIVLSGADSIDRNKPRTDSPKVLKFEWSCTQANTPTICKSGTVSTSSEFRIPAENVVPKEIFNVTLTVTSDFKISASSVQTIEVNPKAALLRIRCEKNCPPHTSIPNVEHTTFLRAFCDYNCQDITDQDYVWDITALKSTKPFYLDSKHTHFGRHGSKLSIVQNTLQAGGKYLITLKLESGAKRIGMTTMAIEYATPPSVDKCEITPALGLSLTTKFKFHCNEKPPLEPKNFYQFFSSASGEKNLIVSGFSPEVFDLQFLLPPSRENEFYVIVSKLGGPKVFEYFHPNVLSATDNRTSSDVIQVYKKFYRGSDRTISEMLSSSDDKTKSEGVKRLQALVHEIISNSFKTDETKEFVKKLTEEVIKDELQSKSGKVSELITLSDSITKLINHHELSRLDPLLAAMATTVCKKMIDKHTENIKTNDKSPSTEDKTTDVETTLRECLEANVREMFEILKPIDRNISLSEIPAIPLDVDIIENYPDYYDVDEHYEEKMEYFYQTTKNVIEATAKAAKALALTMVEGEHSARRTSDNSATLVAKDLGKQFPHTTINLLDDVILHPSKDFVNINHSFDVLLSLWKKDLMWWNHNKTRMATSVVSIQFWHSECKKRIRHFLNPVQVYLKVNKQKEKRFKSGKVNVDENYLKEKPEKLNFDIRVFRIEFPRHSTLFIDFIKGANEGNFDVVTTIFEFPTIEHFSSNTTIASTNMSTIQITNTYSYDVWAYMGILPNKESVKNHVPLTMTYNVSFTSSFCIRWNDKNRAWMLNCQTSENTSRENIICQCTHFSVMAGYFQNASALKQKILTIEIELELQTCYIIFITLAATWGIFCCLFFLTLFKTRREEYYLADNSLNDRYAYLLIVRTENFHHAGTTSNVVIRLKGDKGVSEPHVLNYPDPKMYLLQNQGEDLFILATPTHLGNIKEIELWFDCTGPNPSWSCRDIVIYDMQNRKQTYFKVKTRFSVDRNGTTYLCIGPREEKKGRATNKTQICNHFHTWMLWAGEQNFSYETRVAVIFSNVLMIYMFVLLYLGAPTLTLKDCFDPYEEYIFDFSIVLVAIKCSLLSYMIHLAIAWFFRFSRIEFKILTKTYIKSHKYTTHCLALVCLSIIISSTYLIVYGFWAPENISLIWLTCSLLSCIITVVFVENIFIIIQTSICKFKLKVSFDKRFIHILEFIEMHRLYLSQKFDETLFRPYLQHLYTPLKRAQIIRRRIVVELRRSIYDDLVDLFLYGIYNIILYMFVLVYQGTLTIVSKSEMESMMEGAHTRTDGFSEVISAAKLYDYINETLLPTMHPSFWYENYTIRSGGMMIDNANKIIGVARIRQHRIMSNLCKPPKQVEFLKMECYPGFSLHQADTGDYWSGWKSLSPGKGYDRMNYIWKYATEYVTDTLGTIGYIATYSGGGYVAFLGRTFSNSFRNFQKLLETLWFDDRTRAVFIEFLAYNANYNVFIAVNLLFEQSASGYNWKTLQIDVVRMLFVQNEVENMTMVAFVIFTLWMLVLMFKLILGILKDITTFYKNVWLMIDLLINLMSLLSVTLFILRIKMVERYLKSLESVQHNDFVSYYNMMYLEQFLTYFVGVLVCIATARLWKFLRFGEFFRIMERTLSMASVPLLAVTFSFGIVTTAFAFSGIIIFKNEYIELSFFIKIVATLIQLALKPDQFDLTQYTTFIAAYCYFSLYLIAMQVVLLVYITVIIMAYTKARLELSCLPDRYTVKDYILEQSDYVPIFAKSLIARLRAGGVEVPPVTPKADEFRYANCLGVPKSRLKSMSFIVSCIFRNMREVEEDQRVLTTLEEQLMLRVCNTFVLKTIEDDEHELFFKGHFEGEKVKLVDEKRIDKIAEFVDIMFDAKRDLHYSPTPEEKKIIQCYKMAKQQNKILKKCNLFLKLSECKLDEAEEMLTQLIKELKHE